MFESSYKLPPLDEVFQFILTNKHLPEIPPASEVKAEGINVNEMTALLLKKIEELTLYVIYEKEKKFGHDSNPFARSIFFPGSWGWSRSM